MEFQPNQFRLADIKSRSPNDRGDIILSNSISQLLFDHIEVVDIGLVVLAVVDLHYLCRDHLDVNIVKNGCGSVQRIKLLC